MHWLVCLVLGSLAWASGAHFSGRLDYCRECDTWRQRGTTRVGSTVLAELDKTTLSHTYRDLLDKTHKHVWTYSSSWSRDIGGSTEADAFDNMPNVFVTGYDEDAGFREFVRARIKSGKLDRATLRRLIAAPLEDEANPDTATGNALWAEFKRD